MSKARRYRGYYEHCQSAHATLLGSGAVEVGSGVGCPKEAVKWVGGKREPLSIRSRYAAFSFDDGSWAFLVWDATHKKGAQVVTIDEMEPPRD